MVWWGLLYGLFETSWASGPRFPATEWIFVVPRASCKVNGGNKRGSLFASMVLPEPGVEKLDTLTTPLRL